MAAKRGNDGRFKSPVKEPKNPDCEPATKGYVKHLMRRALPHVHEQNASNWATGILCIVMLFCSLGAAAATLSGATATNPVTTWLKANCGVFCLGVLMSFCVIYDFNATACEATLGPDQNDTAILEKWEPPEEECEPEHEC